MNKILLFIPFYILIYHLTYGQNKLPTFCSHCNPSHWSNSFLCGYENNEECLIKQDCANTNSLKSFLSNNEISNLRNIDTNIPLAIISNQSHFNKNSFNINNNENNSENKSHSMIPRNFKMCEECDILATDSEGHFWGYENETCMINETTCASIIKNIIDKPTIRGNDGIKICRHCERDPSKDKKDYTMWNVEDGEPCRIITSRCPHEKISPLDFCEGCYVLTLGSDYCLFGYETTSCIINEVECNILSDDRFIRTYSNGTVIKPKDFEVDDNGLSQYNSLSSLLFILSLNIIILILL